MSNFEKSVPEDKKPGRSPDSSPASSDNEQGNDVAGSNTSLPDGAKVSRGTGETDAGGLSTFDELKAFLDEMNKDKDSDTEDSVADKQNNILLETDENTDQNQSDTSRSLNEIAEYLASIKSDNDYSSNDEASQHDTIDERLTESAAAEASELQPDSSAVPVADTEETGDGGNEKSILEETDSYVDAKADLPDVTAQVAPHEVETETDAEAKAEAETGHSDSRINNVVQLETKMKKQASTPDDESRQLTPPVEAESPSVDEGSQLSSDNEDKPKEEYEETAESRNIKIASSETKTDMLKQNDSVDKTAGSNRFAKAGMLILVVVVAGVFVFLNQPDPQPDEDKRLQLAQDSALEKPVTASAESEPTSPPETTSAAPVMPDETDNINDVADSKAASEYEAEKLNESMAAGTSEEQPVQDADAAINNTETVTTADTGTAEPQTEAVIETADSSDSELKQTMERIQLALEKNNPPELSASEQSISPGEQATLEEPVVSDEPVATEESVATAESVESQETAVSVEPVASLSSTGTDTNSAPSTKQAVTETAESTSGWSVHLFAFHNEPPPASSLEFLEKAEIPYEVKKTTIDGEIWHRVLVNITGERSAAEKYAAMLKNKFAIKGIWLSKN